MADIDAKMLLGSLAIARDDAEDITMPVGELRKLLDRIIELEGLLARQRQATEAIERMVRQ